MDGMGGGEGKFLDRLVSQIAISEFMRSASEAHPLTARADAGDEHLLALRLGWQAEEEPSGLLEAGARAGAASCWLLARGVHGV